mmetsp:Transcript_11857/g.21144  ORF Transcript_11857/g.21144 Transcript_11857/m.21144 type:complete len:123 (-) Transcript_11857:2248-2616(-)
MTGPVQAVYAEQAQRRALRRQEAQEAKAKAIAASKQATLSMLLSVNGATAAVHKHEQELEIETQKVEDEANRFISQTSRWIHAYRELNQAMDRIASIETWAEQMEAKLLNATDKLESLSGVQ